MISHYSERLINRDIDADDNHALLYINEINAGTNLFIRCKAILRVLYS